MTDKPEGPTLGELLQYDGDAVVLFSKSFRGIEPKAWVRHGDEIFPMPTEGNIIYADPPAGPLRPRYLTIKAGWGTKAGFKQLTVKREDGSKFKPSEMP